MQKSRIGLSFQDHHTLRKQAPMTATSKQANPVHEHALPIQNTSQSGPPAPSAHVHKLPQQVLKPIDSLALRKVQHPNNGRTCVNRLPLIKQEILSHYSCCFDEIGQFPGEQYKFHLKPEYKPARHAPGKFQSTLRKPSKKKSSLWWN